MKNTTTPWTIMKEGAIMLIYGNDGERVCRMIDNKLADAELIIDAVNKESLERLHKRLEELLPNIRYKGHLQGTNMSDWKCDDCGKEWICGVLVPCECKPHEEATQILAQLKNHD